jgi:hypothetical protein
MIAILKFNQQEDRINKHPKNQIIAENNNKFGDRPSSSQKTIAIPEKLTLPK